MLQKSSRYRARQTEDRSLRVIEQERLSWRFLFYRSAESYANLEPSQDYLTYQHGDNSFVFAVCDGVGQSFFGDLASRLLGEVLSDWLCSPAFDGSVSEAGVRGTLGDLLRQITHRATAEVAAVQMPVGTPQMVEEVLNDKRKLGSETTFVCARVDLPTPRLPDGRLIAAWMGDTRLRAWGPAGELRALLPTETFQTDERWSSKSGPVMGDPHILVKPLRGPDGAPAIIGLMAYTDGLAGLDRLADSPTDDDLTSLAAGTRHGGQSDDIAFIELRLQTPVPLETPVLLESSAPVQTPAIESRPIEKAQAIVAVSARLVERSGTEAPIPVAAHEALNLLAPCARRRQQRTPLQRDPVVLASLAGALLVVLYLLKSFVFPDVSLPGVQASRAPTSAPGLLLSTLVWQPSQGTPVAVLTAYDTYWTIIKEAFLNQDQSRLPEVAVGTELELNRKLVGAQPHAVKLSVEHKVTGVASRGDESLLTDVNTISVVASDQSVPYGVSTRPTYVLVFMDNTWKVSYAQ